MEKENEDLKRQIESMQILKMQVEDLKAHNAGLQNKLRNAEAGEGALLQKLDNANQVITELQGRINSQNTYQSIDPKTILSPKVSSHHLNHELEMRDRRLRDLEHEKARLFFENYELKNRGKQRLNDLNLFLHDFEASKAKLRVDNLTEENNMLRKELSLLRAPDPQVKDFASMIQSQRDALLHLRKDNELLSLELFRLKKEKDLEKAQATHMAKSVALERP